MEIPLTRGYVALVDDADYSLVREHSWQPLAGKRDNAYAQRTIGGEAVLMHRLLLAAPDGLQVDHINGDGLDNRRANLRLASQHENQGNRRKLKPASSSFKGVTWAKNMGKWLAQISMNGKRYNLGYFTDEESAARAYDAAALGYWGAFARVNFPPSQT